MKHLGRITCCGHVFSAKDIQGRIMGQREAFGEYDPNLYGGNVSAFAHTQCPECLTNYVLWMKPYNQSYNIVTMSRWNEQIADNEIVDDFDAMEKPQLREWLDQNEVEYVPQWGEERLRELCKAASSR